MRFQLSFETLEGGREKLSGWPAVSSRQLEQCNQKTSAKGFQVCLSKNEGSVMVEMCREKKTGMVEECCQSDGKQVLWACTECGILLGARGVLSKAAWHDHIWIFQDELCGVVLDLLYAHDFFISYTCKRSIAVVQSWYDHGYKLFCATVGQEWTDRCDSVSTQQLS